MKWLSAALSRRGVTLYARSVHWGPIMDAHEEKMLREVGKLGSDGKPVQRAVAMVGADALSYVHSRDAIQHVFDYEVGQLRADDFIVFSHSLGCLVATDWLRERTRARCAQIFTMGCNLQAFNLGAEEKWVCPTQISRGGSWHNLWDPRDGIGWPTGNWIRHAIDHEVSVGGFLARLVPALAHVGYWTSKKLWSKTVPKLLLGA